MIADSQRRDNHDEIALSRPAVLHADVEEAIDGWEEWATLLDDGIYRWLSLARVRARIHAAGLD